MLVLTRKEGESIHVGDNVVITIIRIERQKVRIAISAPPEVTIIREEIIDAYKDKAAEEAKNRQSTERTPTIGEAGGESERRPSE